MPFQCIQFHLIGKCPLTRQNLFALKIGINHEQNSGIVRHITDDNRQGFQSSKLCSVLAAMAGNDFVATIRARTSNQRICDTQLLYAFYCALHSFIIKHLKGMVFERIQLINGNLLYLFELFFLPHFFGGKNIIVAVQTDV